MLGYLYSLGPAVYPMLYFGIIFLGGVVLMPSIYFSLHGEALNIFYIFIASMLAGITADSFWYVVGLRAKKERIFNLSFIKKRLKEAEKLSHFFSRRGTLVTFATKFIFGTRIASHILAGMHRISYPKFLIATGAGTALWFGVFYFLIKSIDLGLDGVKATAFRIEIFFLLVVLITVFINWFTGKYIRKRMLKKEKKEP